MQNHVETMRYLFSYSPIFGDLLLIFLMTNYSLNTTLIATMIKNPDQSWIVSVTYLTLVYAQSCGIFGVHLVAADHSNKIQKPFKRFLSYNSKCSLSLAYKIKFSHFGQAFYTKNPYGISYGHMGVVNMKAFSKVSDRDDVGFF